MLRKVSLAAVLILALVPMASMAAPAYQYSYAVKFVCGYNPSNLGYDATGGQAGEPVVKFGNYATDINIYNFNILSSTTPPAQIEKRVLLLVRSGFPVGREPAVVDPSGQDFIVLKAGQGTLDDCNRIAQLLFGGAIPTPYPLLVGYFVILSTAELDVTAVYTSQSCSNWIFSPDRLDCLDPSGRSQGVNTDIHVNQVQGHKLF